MEFKAHHFKDQLCENINYIKSNRFNKQTVEIQSNSTDSEQLDDNDTRYSCSLNCNYPYAKNQSESMVLADELFNTTGNVKDRLISEISQLNEELAEIDRRGSLYENNSKFVNIFSFKANIDFLYKPISLIKYDTKNELE
mmetsp:Transcript_36030/g.41610  ORF Transcript_36030/g.41610 Transcript_36030/m.41610 type:complete len:140 (+) Transcript_36030:726-1145(+)